MQTEDNFVFQRNVTLEDKKHYFPCPICKKMCLIELTKKNKPYLKCTDCGVQLFIRKNKGINRLIEMVGNMSF